MVPRSRGTWPGSLRVAAEGHGPSQQQKQLPTAPIMTATAIRFPSLRLANPNAQPPDSECQAPSPRHGGSESQYVVHGIRLVTNVFGIQHGQVQ